MKKHLVIICGILHPNPSPTGLCAACYASLLAEDYDICYISLSSNGKEEESFYKGNKVNTITSRRMKWEQRSTGKIKKLIHFSGACQLNFSMMGNMGWFVDAAYKKLEEINTKKKIDAILTVCSPFQAHMAGVKFKTNHQEVRFCAYTVDPFASSDRIIPFFKKFGDLVDLEQRVSASADCLFLSEEVIASRSDIYGKLTNKVVLPYLLPEMHGDKSRIFTDGKIHCVYAGSFYKNIRNPDYMLRVFSKMDKNNIQLHLYCLGCEDIVNSYRNYPNIIIKGYVSQDELQKVYASCDVLIGVGNKMHDFLPSKTYEYLSLRKPIVFFNPQGFNNVVLEKYPHSLQIPDNKEISEAIAQFEEFVIEEEGKTISRSELESLYYKNTAKNVRSILLKGIKIGKQ